MPRRKTEVLPRFQEKYEVTDGCWIWTAAKICGYGVFWLNGRNRGAHVVAYELAHGPIPAGLHLDHLCRNRACVNPSHLEPVTCRENLLRGETRAAANARKTRCPQGHPYTPENTGISKGSRRCRACGRASYHRTKSRGESA